MATVIFTTVPAGTMSDGSFKVSVLVTPRLDPGELPKPFKNWPDTVANIAKLAHLGLDLGIPDGSGKKCTAATKFISVSLTASINKDAYAYLLGSAVCVNDDTKLTVAKADKTPTVKSYDVEQVNSCVNNVRQFLFQHKCLKPANRYVLRNAAVGETLDSLTVQHYPFTIPQTEVAGERAAPAAAPMSSTGQSIYERDVRRVTKDPAQLTDESRRTLMAIASRQANADPSPALPNPLLDHAAFSSRIERRASTVTPPQKYERLFDFAERIALLSNYASLLRPLGIVVDLVVSATSSNDINSASCGRLHLDTDIKNLFPGISLQSKWCRYDPGSFLPASSDKSIDNGYLTLTDYSLIAQDPDSDGHKLAQTFASLAIAKASATARLVSNGVRAEDPQVKNFLQNLLAEDIEQTLPPPSRTLGLMLVERGRASRTQQKIARSVGAKGADLPLTDDSTILFAEDLTRGLIVDLHAKSPDGAHQDWFPMCLRHEELSFGDKTNLKPIIPENIAAQGSIKPCVTTSGDKLEHQAALDEWYAHEVVARWNGSYMCAPPPSYQAMRPSENSEFSIPGQKFGLTADIFQPTDEEGKLLKRPPMRAGGQYAMAVRVETVTGDSVLFRKNPPHQTSEVTLGRWEPLQPPTVLYAGPEDADVKMFEVVLQSDDADDSPSDLLRVIAPPRVSREVAELHIANDQDSIHALVAGFRRLELDKCGGVNQVARPFSDNEFDEPDVPYLPDPAVQALTATFLDEITGEEPFCTLPLHNEDLKRRLWPDAIVHLLSVKGISIADARKGSDDGNPKARFTPDSAARVAAGMDSDSQQFKLELPAGWKGRIRLQSAFGPAGADCLNTMAIWNQFSDAERNEFDREALLRGNHPMLCLPRYIEVVNAVRVPIRQVDLSDTSFASGSFNTTRQILPKYIARKQNSTVADLELTYTFDRKSTGNLRSSLIWKECVDDGKAHFVPRTGASLLFEHLLASNQDAGDNMVENNTHTFKSMQHDFDDTRYHRLTIATDGLSRFREYFKTAAEQDCRSTPTSIEVELKSSARPKAPDVLYIVPTFGWKPTQDGNHSFQNRRLGAGLRVFVRPRWRSAGEDELLGVVVADSPDVQHSMQTFRPIAVSNTAQRGNETTQTYLSTWGGDPVRLSNGYEAGPLHLDGWQPEGTTNAAVDNNIGVSTSDQACDAAALLAQGGACGWSLQLSEPGATGTVAVVGYPVQSDPSRGFLFSDIIFDRAPQYGTFVRLALVRYQPHSIQGVEISPVVMADFALLNPDRAVTVQRIMAIKPGDKHPTNALQVQIIGIPNLSSSNSASGAVRSANEFEVTLERREYKDQNGMGWQQLSDGDLSAQLIPDPENDRVRDMPNTCEKILWSGKLFPNPLCAERRIAVREYEIYDADPVSSNCSTQARRRRLVYADVVTLE